jgi:hypothetical protein
MIRHLAAPVLFILIVLLFFPTRGRLEFDGDEGLNLMRAMLIDKGYALYDDIWSDQPPVYPHVLAAAFRVTGYKVGVARFISTLFASMIVWALFQIHDRLLGRGAAVLASFLIIISPGFLQLSVSVMVGLPALAMGTVALALLLFWHADQRLIWLLLCGILLAVAIQTKLFLAILAPIFGIGLLIPGLLRWRAGSASWTALIAPAALYGFGVLIPLGLITWLLIGPENLPLLTSGHLAARQVSEFQSVDNQLHYHLREARPLIILAVLGAIRVVQHKQRLLLYPLFWFLFGFVVLLFLQPIWYHHQLLVTIPAVTLASYALMGAWQWLRERSAQALGEGQDRVFQVLAAVGLFILLFAFKPPSEFSYLSLPPTFEVGGLGIGARKDKMFATLVHYAAETEWIVTDKPMYAFRARIPVPPEIAVLSRKRLETGDITEARLIEIVTEYEPEQILIARFDLPNLEMAIADHYSLEEQKDGDFRLYVRRDLLDE